MAELHIHRAHALGLARARELAWQWAETVERKFQMECTVIEGDDRDVVEFRRSGVDGRLVVAADSFDLTAKLGLLLGVFAGRIESEIEANLDALLAGEPKKARKAGSRSAPTATPRGARAAKGRAS